MELTLSDARDKAYGIPLFVLEYPATDVFSVITVSFPKKRQLAPVTYLSWLLSQSETRSYVFEIDDFWLLLSELKRAMSSSDTLETVIETSVFESMRLKLSTLDAVATDCEISIVISNDSLNIKFSTPYGSDTFYFADPALLCTFIERAYATWVDAVPFFILNEDYRTIIHAQTAEIFKKDSNSYAHSVSVQELMKVKEELYDKLDSFEENFSIASRKIELLVSGEDFVLNVEGTQIVLPMKRFEAFVDYSVRRRISALPASYSQFFYDREKKLKERLKQRKADQLLGRANGAERSYSDV